MLKSNRRILLVDDNTDIHDDFKSILAPQIISKNQDKIQKLADKILGNDQESETKNIPKEIHYNIDDAYQGEEAVTMIEEAEKQNQPYAIVFMDVRMPPGIDGIQAIQRIWKNHPYIEVVLCTAYSDYTWDEMLTFFGETDHLLFVKKPFDQVAIKQTALTLTKKWELDKKNREYVYNLEDEIAKRTKDLTKSNSQLRKKNEEIINLVHIITHDLRSPLTGIVGSLTILEKEIPNMPDSAEEFIKLCNESATFMDELISEILDLARWESGKACIKKQQVPIRELCQSVIKRMKTKLLEKHIIVSNNLEAQILADEKALIKIFMNLIGNSINYMGNTFKPTITISEKKEEDGYTFTVRDNGIGIPETIQKDIFNKFTRGSNHSNVKGSGIGLSIVKSMIEAQGGHIGVDSTVGEGSSFYFFLPNS